MHLWLLPQRMFITFQSAARIALAAVVMLAACSPAMALIVEDQTDTTTAPADDPGWNNVTLGGRNYIYLGDSWALSAFHVGLPDLESETPGADANDDDELLNFFTGSFTESFPRIKNQHYRVRNPAGLIASGGSEFTDLRLIRLNGDPGLRSIFGPNPAFTIASSQIFESTPVTQREVVIIGNGRTREADQSHWDATVVAGSNNDTWTEICGPCAYDGYKSVSPADRTKRWGTNQIADEDCLFNSNCGNDNNLRGRLTLSLGVGPTDVMSLVTRFDEPSQGGLTNEAQAVSGDSGSAVFYNGNGNWELLGIVNAVFQPFVNGTFQSTYDRGPDAAAAVYGSFTTFADLSYYHDEIMAIINANQNYSILGDINLDGNVSGNGSGPSATDDVTAFVEGWGYQQDVGDITSWKNGDLNLDGITNVYDFFMLRNALQSAGSAAGVSSLNLFGSSVAGVPEPAAILLALFGAGLLAMGKRRSRSAAAD